MNFNIVLCGFMGCGKTIIGKAISERLNLDFFDVDLIIEKQEGKSISEIFKVFGEDYFRLLEYKTIKILTSDYPKIISTGGGTVLFDRNLKLLKQNGKIIFLNTPLSIIKSRLKNDSTRPLLDVKDKISQIDKLYADRLDTYKRVSDIIINANDCLEEAVENILLVL